MKEWPLPAQRFAIQNRNTLSLKQIATHLDKNPKTVAEWLRKRGYLKVPRYSEMETFMLEISSAKSVQPFFENRSINALKIKKCRIKAGG